MRPDAMWRARRADGTDELRITNELQVVDSMGMAGLDVAGCPGVGPQAQ